MPGTVTEIHTLRVILCGGVWATRSPKKVTKLSLLVEGGVSELV